MSPESADARVLLLYTGGTIGMTPERANDLASPLRPGSRGEFAANLARMVPRLGQRDRIHWELHTCPGVPPADSSDINADHWIEMARYIRDQYDRWDGFVILHGSDTMAYTASALSFLLKNLAKPVVLTGSQLPLIDERTDACSNLANAVRIAAHRQGDVPLVPEVVICFGQFLLRGNRARKASTSNFTGFTSPNHPPIGHLGERIEIDRRLVRCTPDPDLEPFTIDEVLERDVIDFTLFPGLPVKRLHALLADDSLRGCIIRTFGAGNVMSDPGIIGELDAAIRAGKIILNITQCSQGFVEMGLYQSSSRLLEIGVISGLDLTPEAALAKMLWALATYGPDEAREQIQINQRGEQSKDIFELRYRGAVSGPAGRVHSSAQPSGQYRKERLIRAILRIADLRFDGSAAASGLAVFVGLQARSTQRSRDDRHCAAVLKAPAREIIDMTEQVRQFTSDTHEIAITLDSGPGQAFSFSAIYLMLICESNEE